MIKEMLDEAKAKLKEIFGFQDFRKGQDEIIRDVLLHKDVLAVMPTGGGKSLCYQLPALLVPGLTVVVSPLIALMKDQVDGLTAKNVCATFINSMLTQQEQNLRMQNLEKGVYKIVYVAPERFRRADFMDRLKSVNISLFAVDEAHCISEWGHDFRPDYMRLAEVVKRLGNPPVIALTATATHEVREDIKKQLVLSSPSVFVTGFRRDNLVFNVAFERNASGKKEKLQQVFRRMSGASIVYAGTRNQVEEIAELLSGMNKNVLPYHAGMQDRMREDVQNKFMCRDAEVVVATNAFGMGIDRSDIRFIVHYHFPGTIESYYQEAGRAGRDGGLSECTILYAPQDRFLHEMFINSSYPSCETVTQVFKTILEFNEEPVWRTYAEIARRIETHVDESAVASVVKILEKNRILRRMDRYEKKALIIGRRTLLENGDRLISSGRNSFKTRTGIKLLENFPAAKLEKGINLTMEELSETTGLDGDSLLKGLKQLQQEEFIEFTPPFRGRGISVIIRNLNTLHERVDFDAILTQRQREYQKLENMEEYISTKKCRVSYVLDYFGDSQKNNECGLCDNCQKKNPKRITKSMDDIKKFRDLEIIDQTVQYTKFKEHVGEDEELFRRLIQTRKEIARNNSLAPYLIFPDRTLREMARNIPRDKLEMLQISGVGEALFENYGKIFIAVIRDWILENEGN